MLMKTVLYQDTAFPQDGSTPTITGRNLAHAHRNAVERAFVAAGLHLGRIALVKPAVEQAVTLAGASLAYAQAAVVVSDDPALCLAVLAGNISLLDAAATVSNRETLAEHFARSTPSEWLEVGRVIGPAVLWDRMISPLV